MKQLIHIIQSYFKFEYKISTIYFIVGFVWIFFSDTVFGILIEDKGLLTEISIVKGFTYVIITTLLLYYFVKKQMKKLYLAENLAKEKSKELQIQNEEYKRINEELIKAKEKAEESDRLKTAFLQNISHEIRTPLNAICGFSGLLNKSNISSEKRIGYTSIIQNSSNQLLSIVSDILTISSLETGQEKLNIGKVCVNHIIDELFPIFKQLADNKEISLHAHPELSNIHSQIYADKTKITQILTNLLSNAIKFTKQGLLNLATTLRSQNSNSM